MTATMTVMAQTSHGKIFALADRPKPNAARRPCTYSAVRTWARPSRGPSYRWYPMSWMTLDSDIGGLPRGEKLGDAVTSQVQAVQRQVELGHRLQDPVVAGFGLERHEQHPALVAHRQPQR